MQSSIRRPDCSYTLNHLSVPLPQQSAVGSDTGPEVLHHFGTIACCCMTPIVTAGRECAFSTLQVTSNLDIYESLGTLETCQLRLTLHCP